MNQNNDLISRASLMEAFETDAFLAGCVIRCVIKETPAVDAEPVRHGRWNEPTGRFQDGFWVCSACNFCSEATAAPVLYKFCPNCGAKMDQEVQYE